MKKLILILTTAIVESSCGGSGNYNYVNPDVEKNYIRKYFGPVDIMRLKISILVIIIILHQIKIRIIIIKYQMALTKKSY
mgnify:CR=1 FL=1